MSEQTINPASHPAYGLNPHADKFVVRRIGLEHVTARVRLYEISRPGLPAICYTQVDGLPDVQVSDSLSMLDLSKLTPEADFMANISILVFEIKAKSLPELVNVYAHNGLVRAGGARLRSSDFSLTGQGDYAVSAVFRCADLRLLSRTSSSHFDHWPIVQQLSFDITEFNADKLASKLSIRNTSLYAKLAVQAELVLGDLSIVCNDSDGLSAREHVALQTGIAVPSMRVNAEVRLSGFDATGQLVSDYKVIVANPDYSDDPISLALPRVSKNVVVARLDVQYNIELTSIGETLTLTDSAVLTDSTLATLRQLTIYDLQGGASIGFTVKDSDGKPVEGAKISIGDKTVVTDQAGLAVARVRLGTYVYTIAYESIIKTIPITVTSDVVVDAMVDVKQIDMLVTIVGTDSYALPGITLDVNEGTRITDEAGTIRLTGAEGRLFRITHKLGETLHSKVIRATDGQKSIMLFNTFDKEQVFTTEFT